jgi:hypothetical protein
MEKNRSISTSKCVLHLNVIAITLTGYPGARNLIGPKTTPLSRSVGLATPLAKAIDKRCRVVVSMSWRSRGRHFREIAQLADSYEVSFGDWSRSSNLTIRGTDPTVNEAPLHPLAKIDCHLGAFVSAGGARELSAIPTPTQSDGKIERVS